MVYLRFTTNLFLRCVTAIYVMAFVSLYVQNAGLFGKNGLLPAENLFVGKSSNIFDNFNENPTLLWFSSVIGLNTEYMYDLICLSGIFLAFLGFLSQGCCNKSLYFILWIYYLSLYNVGQIFVSDLADELLLEVGLLCILIAPLPFTKTPPTQTLPHDSIVFWLARLLLFRVAFTGSVAKLSSKSTHWYDFNALSTYFESMPLPNAISRYAHYFPVWFLKIVTVVTVINDLFVPLFFLVPIRTIRTLAFYIQVFVQIGILTTGNYGYYNLLYIVLCLSLLDDRSFFSGLATDRNRSWICTIFRINTILYAMTTFCMVYNFHSNPSFISSLNLTFISMEFNLELVNILRYASYFVLASFTFECMKSINLALKLRNIMNGFTWTLTCSFCIQLVALGTFNVYSLHPSISHTIANDSYLYYNKFTPYKIVNNFTPPRELINYDSRYEIVVFGASDIRGPWYEYQFLFKPGNVTTPPPFIAPYRPLLDRQMFFAARSLPSQNPWLASFVYRLLNNQKEVLLLLNTDQNPFTKEPPKFVKVSLYKYQFSSKIQRKKGIWWNRKLLVSEFMPPMNKSNKALVNTLKAHKILLTDRKPIPINPIFKDILDTIKSRLLTYDPRYLMLLFFLPGIIFIYMSV